jgi:hypothetical protein
MSGGLAYVSGGGAVGAGAAIAAAGGTATSGTVLFSNSNGVSFGLAGSVLTASILAGPAAGIGGISAGTQLQTSGSLLFSNLNGVTFGMTNSSVLTASVAAQTSLSYSNLNGVSFGIVGSTLTASVAGGGAGSVNFSAGTTSGNLGSVVFGNANGVSFGLNGSTLTGSIAAQSVQTQSVHNVTLAGNTSGALALISSGVMTIAGGNNITVSQAGNAFTISGANAGGAQTGISGMQVSNTTYTAGTVIFQNANGISFGSSGANGISASYTVPTQSNQSIGFIGGSNTTLTSSGTLDARSLYINGIGNITVGYSAGSVLLSAATAAGLTTGGAYVAGNTTGQSSSSTYNLTNFNVSAAGIISVGWSSNSLIFSSPATTGVSQSMYATGNTTQSTSGSAALGSLLFNFLGGISGGVTAGSVVISGPTGGGGGVAISAGTNSTSTGTVQFSNANNVSFGMNTTGVITASVPSLSTLSGTGLVSISTNGSTISIGAAIPQMSFFQPLPMLNTTVTQQGNGSIAVYPALHPMPFTASRADMMASISVAALALSTEAQALSFYVGLYSLNGSTLSLASSGSQSYQWTNSSNGSDASISGMRRFSAPINVNYTGGFDLFVAMMSNTTFSNTNGASISNVGVPIGPNIQLRGLVGQVAANSMQFVPGQGIYSTTSAGLPASIGLSQISGAGSAGVGPDNFVPIQFLNVSA